MNLSLDFHRLVPVVAIAAVALAALALLVRGVGGGKTGAGGAQQVLDQAFAGGTDAKSGRFQGALTVSLQGVPSQAARPLDVKLSGAFDRGKSGKPQFDIDGTFAAAGQGFTFGALSSGGRTFVKFRGRVYAVPAGQLGTGASAQTPLSTLGLNPRGWFTNVRDAGATTLAGATVEHVTADLDVGKAFGDLEKVAARSGQGGGSGSAQQLQNAVKQVRVDLYAGKSDHQLRKVDATGTFDGSAASGGPAIHGTLAFNLQFTDLNKPQRIRAPRNAAPISRAKHPAKPSRSAGARRTRTRTRTRQAYVSCVQQANDLQALDRCQQVLP